MENRHAIIDPKTGLVRNIVIWEGAAWTPPYGHYVVHNCDGQIGDYWHQDAQVFYTPQYKRRFKDAQGKVGESELQDHEKDIEQRLVQIYDHADNFYRMKHRMRDLTKVENQVPSV